MTTPKQQAILAFRGGKPDRVPVCTFLGGSWSIVNSGNTLQALMEDPHKTADVLYEANDALDNDIITIGTASTPLLFNALGGKIKFNKKASVEILEELIKTPDDLEQLKLIDIKNDPGMKWTRAYSQRMSELVDEKRLILAGVRGPFTIAGHLFGLEELSKALYKNSNFIHSILEFSSKLVIDFIKPLIKDGIAHGVVISDPTASGDLISKRHFEEFAMPYIKQVMKEVKEAQGVKMLHICGNIRDRLSLIADTGIDCLSLDTKVDIGVAKKAVGDRICLAGNVDPVQVLKFGDKTEIRKASIRCLQEGARDGGFVLMPGCDLAASVPLENIQCFVETGHQWKEYVHI